MVLASRILPIDVHAVAKFDDPEGIQESEWSRKTGRPLIRRSRWDHFAGPLKVLRYVLRPHVSWQCPLTLISRTLISAITLSKLTPYYGRRRTYRRRPGETPRA
jgi:hypothetical protein